LRRKYISDSVYELFHKGATSGAPTWADRMPLTRSLAMTISERSRCALSAPLSSYLRSGGV
jgi:hypothetical protein